MSETIAVPDAKAPERRTRPLGRRRKAWPSSGQELLVVRRDRISKSINRTFDLVQKAAKD